MEREETDPTDIPFISFPDQESLVDLLLLAGPMFFVMVGKIMGYSAMTIRDGNFGMVSLACHNVLMRIFFFFGTIGDAPVLPKETAGRECEHRQQSRIGA